MLRVFDIQYSSYHDGPGIRTVVFLKGCNLSCEWCQNPESQKSIPELMHFDQACIGCGSCLKACANGALRLEDGQRVYDRNRCVGCGKCAEQCPTDALRLCGEEMTEEAVLRKVLRDRQIYEMSGGGMTLSGGEPLLQADGCRRLLELAKGEGLHTAIETAACLPVDRLERLLPHLDLVLCDVKMTDDTLHRRYCGGSAHCVAENLRLLAERGIETQVRVPVIPGVNDTPEAIADIARFCGGFPQITNITLLPFHKLGAGKYAALDRTYAVRELNTPSEEQMKMLGQVLNDTRATIQKG